MILTMRVQGNVKYESWRFDMTKKKANFVAETMMMEVDESSLHPCYPSL